MKAKQVTLKLTIFAIIKILIMAMNKNTVLAWATYIMIFTGISLIALGAFRFNALKGRV